MPTESNIEAIMTKLEALQVSVNSIAEAVKKIQEGKAVMKDWIDQEEAMRITSLKKSSLYELRKAHRLTSSKLGRKTFYRLSEIENMLDENERNQ